MGSSIFSCIVSSVFSKFSKGRICYFYSEKVFSGKNHENGDNLNPESYNVKAPTGKLRPGWPCLFAFAVTTAATGDGVGEGGRLGGRAECWCR